MLAISHEKLLQQLKCTNCEWSTVSELWEHLQQCLLGMQPCKHIFHTQVLVIYFFATPHIKLNLGQQITGGLLIANQLDNHYDRPIRNTGERSDNIYETFSCTCTALLRILPATAKFAIMLSQNDFPEPNQHVLTFLHPIFDCAASHTEHSWS